MDYNIGPNQNLMELIAHLFAVMATVKAVMILAISVFTFFILEVFLNKTIEIKNKNKISKSQSKIMLTCIAMLMLTIIPLWIIIYRMLYSKNIDTNSLLWLIGISVVGVKIFTILLRRQLEPDDPRRKNSLLIIESVTILFNIITENIAQWIQTAIIGFINMIIRVIHVPFVAHYFLVSVVLNLLISYILTEFIGSSQLSGEVNIIGSLIGGMVHNIVSKHKVRELRDHYVNKGIIT
jgi:hypothetical protein